MWDGEKRIAKSILDNQKTLVHTGFGIGKTRTAARAALWFLTSFSPSIVLTTAPTWRQVESQLWGEIRNAYKNAHVPIGGKLTSASLTFSDKWFALGISTNDPERFQGYHSDYIMVIVDEASGVDDAIIDIATNIQYTKILMIGNPSSSEGRFYEYSRDPSWNAIHISCFETPNVQAGEMLIPGMVTREWVEQKKREWGEDNPLYIAKVLGLFPQNTQDCLIPLSAIEKSINAPLIAKADDLYTLGVDVARFGSDETVFSLFHGAVELAPRAYHGIDTMQTAGYVKEVKRECKIRRQKDSGEWEELDLLPDNRIGIDDTGVGGGVTDRLREDGISVTPVNFGARAREPEYYCDCRSEMAISFADAVKKGEIKLYDDPVQTAQIADLRTKMTSRGRRLEPKEEMKKRLGRSPDRADATLIANYMRTYQLAPLMWVVEG